MISNGHEVQTYSAPTQDPAEEPKRAALSASSCYVGDWKGMR